MNLIPNLSTASGIDQLRAAGYRIGQFRGPTSLMNERQLIEKVVKQVLVPSHERFFISPAEVKTTVNLLLDFLFRPIPGTEFARFNPIPEHLNLAELILEAKQSRVPLKIVCPVCPDYPDVGFDVGCEAGETAIKAIKSFPSIISFFRNRNLSVEIEMDIADVEAVDPFLQPRLGISREEFLRRLKVTEQAIKQKVTISGLKNYIVVGSMLERLKDHDVNFVSRQDQIVKKLLTEQDKKKQRIIEELNKSKKLPLSLVQN